MNIAFFVRVDRILLFFCQICVLIESNSRAWFVYIFVGDDVEKIGTGALCLFTSLTRPIAPMHLLDTLLLLHIFAPGCVVIVIFCDVLKLGIKVAKRPTCVFVDTHGQSLVIESLACVVLVLTVGIKLVESDHL